MSNVKASKAQDTTQAQAQEAQEGTLSASDVAALAGVSAKDLRRWMRTQARSAGAGDALPGKGGRYAYTQAQAEAIARAYGASKASKGTQAPAAAILAALSPVE